MATRPAPRMNIAYLVNQYPKVSHSFIRTEMLALEAQGHAVTRIAMRGWDAELVDPVDKAEREKTRYVLARGALPMLAALFAVLVSSPARFLAALATAWRLSRGGERGMLYHLIYLAEACVVLRWVRAADVQHIHSHFGSNSTAVALLVRVLGGPPYSFTVHGPEEFDKPLQWKLRKKIAGADAVIAITSFCRSQLYRWSDPRDWPKIRIVHCAIDPRFNAVAATPPPANRTLVCVGRLCEQKGQLLLVEAIAELKRRGVAADLVLAGDGEMRGDVERAIVQAGLADQVTITGWVSADEVRDHLERARALVLPSFGEGLPVVIMEAMARQRPVLSTYIAGIPELVRNGIDGFLVPAGDRNALANMIEAVLALPADRLADMGRTAQERVFTRHTDHTEAARLARIFAGSVSDERS